MFQFSIRNLLIGTFYCALAFAVSAAFGLDVFVAINLFFLHIATLCVLFVASFEYSGYRRRFCIGALVVESLFAVGLLIVLYDLESFITQSIVGFFVAYFAGICSAGTYRAIRSPEDAYDSWRPLDTATRVMIKLLPDDSCQQNE